MGRLTKFDELEIKKFEKTMSMYYGWDSKKLDLPEILAMLKSTKPLVGKGIDVKIKQ
jgi:hypothetical protein